MPIAPVRKTTIQGDLVEITLCDADDPTAAGLTVHIFHRQAPCDPNQPLAVIQAIALAAAREAISGQIQERTRTHGPVPRSP